MANLESATEVPIRPTAPSAHSTRGPLRIRTVGPIQDAKIGVHTQIKHFSSNKSGGMIWAHSAGYGVCTICPQDIVSPMKFMLRVMASMVFVGSLPCVMLFDRTAPGCLHFLVSLPAAPALLFPPPVSCAIVRNVTFLPHAPAGCCAFCVGRIRGSHGTVREGSADRSNPCLLYAGDESPLVVALHVCDSMYVLVLCRDSIFSRWHSTRIGCFSFCSGRFDVVPKGTMFLGYS